MANPKLVVIAGPNGAGKSTSAVDILRGALRVDEFVNADVIAQGLSGFAPERVAFAAGRIMLDRIQELADKRVDFAFETTLASRGFAPWIARLTAWGYEFHLVYVWLRSPQLALERVAERVRRGGHSVAPEVIERRYYAGIRNFFDLYRPLATLWQVLDNGTNEGIIIAAGSGTREAIAQAEAWQAFQTLAQHGNTKGI